MTPPFLLLLAAAAGFRILSADSRRIFQQRLERLLPRNVVSEHLRVLTEEFPDLLGEFRRRGLPYSALHLFFNMAACLCFTGALWYFPPSGLERWDLMFVRYGSLLLIPVAFVADAVIFARMLVATFGRGAEADGAV